ncbi:hypothetical protein MMA231_04102 (plasmid) [Asticcacaulis sp. MM231]|uniref:hypothetical protein n=1 Tax=Asticcacaulis sp. MM231 TaxID=3157666 RepID=UPI0032D58C52
MSITSHITNEPTLTILKSDLEDAIRTLTPPGKRQNISATLDTIFQVKETQGEAAAITLLMFAMIEFAAT